MASEEEIASALGVALVWAVGQQHVGLVRALVEAAAEVETFDEDEGVAAVAAVVNYDDVDEGVALVAAVEWGNIEVVRMLLDAGAAVDGTGNLDGDNWTALERAAYGPCGSGGHPEMVRMLIQAGAALETPLMLAAGIGEVEIVRMLLAAGAMPCGATRGDGTTAMRWAEECDQEEVVRMLRAAAGETLKESAPEPPKPKPKKKTGGPK